MTNTPSAAPDAEPPPGENTPAPTPEPNSFATLAPELSAVLTNPNPDMDTLARQADLLDCLLYTVMREGLQNATRRGYFSGSDLGLALRIQKQCADTIKASGAIDYMRTVNSLHSGVWPYPAPPVARQSVGEVPLPPKNDEQTDKET